MIEIATLLLGLISGPRTIELAAAPDVASAVVEVDGEVAAGVVPEDGAGSVRVSFGGGLLPHRVTAIAYDEAGREIGRDEEWVNLPRPLIDAELVLHGDPWTPRSASLEWKHLAREPATVERVTATLDDQPIAVSAEHEIALPELAPEVPHVLRVDVAFSNGERIELARAFGGGGVDEVETRLLPVRVTLLPGAEWPDEPADLAECLAAPDGVRVHGWEEGPAEVLIVRDLSARPRIARLLQRGLVRQHDVRALRPQRYDHLLPLREGDRLRQVWPVPERIARKDGVLTLFPSTDSATDNRSIVSLLRERLDFGDDEEEQELARAVAVAGFLAYGSRRPSAVVLVLGDPPPDSPGDFPPAAVRAYLDALHVPFQVWSITGGGTAPGWGPAVDTSNYHRLSNAVIDLRAALDRQRLVWLAGAGLPQEVRFADCGCCAPAEL